MVDNILQMSLPYTEIKNNSNNFYYNLFKNTTNTQSAAKSQQLSMPKANEIKNTNITNKTKTSNDSKTDSSIQKDFSFGDNYQNAKSLTTNNLTTKTNINPKKEPTRDNLGAPEVSNPTTKFFENIVENNQFTSIINNNKGKIIF